MSQGKTNGKYLPPLRIDSEGAVTVIAFANSEDYFEEVYVQEGSAHEACGGVNADKVKHLLDELKEELAKALQETES